MKKNPLLLLLVSISLFSCNNTVKKSISPLSNLNTDFPVSETLEFTPLNKYTVVEGGFCIIADSVLWHFEDNGDDFGSCYNLNTGEKISTIASVGTSANELTALERFDIVGDLILLSPNRTTTKTFLKKEILDNVPVKNRTVTITTVPDSILVRQTKKLPNGSILATIRPPFEFEKNKINAINNNSIVIFNENEAKAYETIKYDSHEIKKATDREIATNDLLKWSYAQGFIKTKGNDMAIFSVNNQFILYTFDLNNGKVVNEKRYTKIMRDGMEGSFTTINDMNIEIVEMESNDKYIICMVDGYFNEENKNPETIKNTIFVFDWKLNPIKKFDLPEQEDKRSYYLLSNDCNSVYFCQYDEYEEELTLHKAAFNL